MDCGPRLLAVGSDDAAVVAWLAGRAGATRVAPDDPRVDPDDLELAMATMGVDTGRRRARHRALDHRGRPWFASFDPTLVAEAVARYVIDRQAAARGGTWLRVPTIGRAGADDVPGPVAVALLDPRCASWLEESFPYLERAGLAVHPSPLLAYAADTGLAPVPPGWRYPHDDDRAVAPRRPVALLGSWDTLHPAEVVRSLADATEVHDQTHLEAILALVERTTHRAVRGPRRELATAVDAALREAGA